MPRRTFDVSVDDTLFRQVGERDEGLAGNDDGELLVNDTGFHLQGAGSVSAAPTQKRAALAMPTNVRMLPPLA